MIFCEHFRAPRASLLGNAPFLISCHRVNSHEQFTKERDGEKGRERGRVSEPRAVNEMRRTDVEAGPAGMGKRLSLGRGHEMRQAKKKWKLKNYRRLLRIVGTQCVKCVYVL